MSTDERTPAASRESGAGPTARADEYVSEFPSEFAEEPPRSAAAPATGPDGTPTAAGADRMTPAAAWSRLALAGGLGAALAAAFLAVPSPGVPPEAEPPPAPAATGTARIVSRPSGAEVFINGTRQGVAPLALTLPAGAYRLELRRGPAVRRLPLVVEAGATTGEFVDLPAAATLRVDADEAGVPVTVDGIYRGVTPYETSDLEPGEYRVAIGTGRDAVVRTVTLEAGGTARIEVATRVTVAGAGWLTIRAPIELRLIENGQVIGTSDAPRVMVPAGRRNLVLVNEGLGFRTTLTVEVPAGVTVPVTIPVPDEVAAGVR